MSAPIAGSSADHRLRLLGLLAGSHGVVSMAHLRAAGVDDSTLLHWVAERTLVPVGARSFALRRSRPGWRTSLAAAVFDTGGVVSGRAAARLHHVAGFRHDDVELLVDRACRVPGAVLVRPPWPPGPHELTAIDGFPVVTLARLATIDATAFRFTSAETALLHQATPTPAATPAQVVPLLRSRI